jgi:hypothetical protein
MGLNMKTEEELREYNRIKKAQERSTPEGKKKNVEAVLKWEKENPEKKKQRQREWLAKKRAMLKSTQKEQIDPST